MKTLMYFKEPYVGDCSTWYSISNKNDTAFKVTQWEGTKKIIVKLIDNLELAVTLIPDGFRQFDAFKVMTPVVVTNLRNKLVSAKWQAY